MNVVTLRFRFSLRTLLLAVFLFSVIAAFPVTVWFVAAIAPVSGPAVGVVAFLLVPRTARPDCAASRWPSFRGWFIACLGMLAVIGCWFIRHRWVTAFDDDRWPRPFPYPDLFLLEIHDWWDRLHPAGPGYLKIHGEFYAVLLGTNVLFLLACVVAGTVCGYIFRNSDFVPAAPRLTG